MITLMVPYHSIDLHSPLAAAFGNIYIFLCYPCIHSVRFERSFEVYLSLPILISIHSDTGIIIIIS